MTMSKPFTVTIPGEPSPWAVYIRRGKPNAGIMALRAYQTTLRLFVARAWADAGHQEPVTGLVELDMEFWRGLPNWAPNRVPRDWRGGDRDGWIRMHLGMRPDRDNLGKACQDALQGILYVNDSQVVDGRTSKHYADCSEGRTVISMVEL